MNLLKELKERSLVFLIGTLMINPAQDLEGSFRSLVVTSFPIMNL